VGPSTGLFDIGGQLVTPPIRGRAGELKVIAALVTALVQGRGGILIIEGPPGIGKSRLLTEVMALADKAGVRTLFGEAFEYQQTVPFFSLFMATLGADPPVGGADALRRLGGWADLRYWVVHDLADAIDAAAAENPVAIVLEDIHWADNGTLLALRSLAATPPGAPVLWVLTARTGAGGPGVQETLSVLQRADAAVVRVAAMSASAVADMVCDAVRANADASLLNLAAKAHGNPFLVRELVGVWTRRAGSLSAPGVRWPAVTRCRDVWAQVCSSDSTCSPAVPARWCGWPRCCRTGFRLVCWPRCWNASRCR
jgi:AAA ATPase domain